MRSPAHGKPGIANLSPIGEREITEVLDQVSRTLHGRQTRSRNRPARGLDGRTLALLVPWWANELIGNPLSTTRCRELQIVQAHLLAFIHVHDALLDGHAALRRQRVADIAPLLFEAQRRLATLFAPGDPFWSEFEALLRDQASSARWEMRAPPPGRFDAQLLRRLSQKLALFRWPAFAVPRLAHRPRAIPLLDRILDAFYLVLQLLDDLHDVRDDAASGQINAVLAASGGTSLSLRDLAPGVLRVCSLAQERLSWIETHSRPTSTLRRTCAYLSDCVRKAAVPSRQMEQARLLTRSLRQVVDSISLAAARPAELARAARVRG